MQRTLRKHHALRWLLAFFICAGLSSAQIAEAAEAAGPKQVIEAVNAALLDAMSRADELGYAGRYAHLEPVITNSYALSFMATQSIGRFWKTLTEQQRALFLKTYREWTLATYAGRFDGFSGERFELVSESKPVQGSVTVISKLVEANGQEIAFHYVMRKVDERWRVIDIQISGVSQLALTRAQFTDVIKNKSFDGLIAMLKEKTAGFARPKKN